MVIDPSLPVRDLALGVAGADAVFEAHHIDYSCGGTRSLHDACLEHGVPLEVLLGALATSADPKALSPEAEWLVRPLSELTAFIVDTHHEYARGELGHIRPALEKVVRLHGPSRPELFQVRRLVTELEASLLPHMRREERLLFPYIDRLDRAAREGRPLEATASIAAPIQAAMMDHGREDKLLSSLSRATHAYAMPEWGSAEYEVLFTGLKALAADLRKHMHLENNVLYPRALEIEREANR